MNIFLKTEDEIELMREANLLVGRTLAEVGRHIKEGVTTLFLDKIAEEFIRDNGAIPTFKGFPNPYGSPFPGSICTSVNDIVVHGIPSEDVTLKDGDIISVDCGTLLNGFNGDSCYTFCVGDVCEEVKNLLHTIQDCCQAKGYGIVRELTGHGIGREMHEDPAIPNYGKRGSGILLKTGMCIAIEPMVTMGGREIGILPDRWSIVTRDRQPAAHFEHTVAIRAGKADILSSFEEIELLEGQNF